MEISKGKKMAGEKIGNFKWSAWRYTIKDNPHPKHHPDHVKWHNDFYDACKEIGRKIK